MKECKQTELTKILMTLSDLHLKFVTFQTPPFFFACPTVSRPAMKQQYIYKDARGRSMHLKIHKIP